MRVPEYGTDTPSYQRKNADGSYSRVADADPEMESAVMSILVHHATWHARGELDFTEAQYHRDVIWACRLYVHHLHGQVDKQGNPVAGAKPVLVVLQGGAE